jgi:hypothetical protein
MDVYHIWFNLKDGVGDIPFAESARAYLDHLKGEGTVAGYRITRRKLGLGPPQLPQWHITVRSSFLPHRPSREFSPRSQFQGPGRLLRAVSRFPRPRPCDGAGEILGEASSQALRSF